MRPEKIKAIGIDAAGQLWVQPASATFELIYRAGMEVRWDTERASLYAPKPREWSCLRWFEQIRNAAVLEYGLALKIGEGTSWTNIDDDLKQALCALPCPPHP